MSPMPSDPNTAIRLPDWSAVHAEASDGAPLNPLERFIFDNEPAGDAHATQFRRQLSDLIEWVRHQ